MLFYIWLFNFCTQKLMLDLPKKNWKSEFYFICIFTILHLFVLLLVVRLFLLSLFLFDSIDFP